jgi:aspartyl/asparaginyl-tRNA synthetase
MTSKQIASEYYSLWGSVWCRYDAELITRLQHVAETPFKRLTYTSAIELLKSAVDEGHTFENNEIVWGMDMASEHERCFPVAFICTTSPSPLPLQSATVRPAIKQPLI